MVFQKYYTEKLTLNKKKKQKTNLLILFFSLFSPKIKKNIQSKTITCYKEHIRNQ